MRIIEDEYNWKRAASVVITTGAPPFTVEFEEPLKIYRIRGEGDISKFETKK